MHGLCFSWRRQAQTKLSDCFCARPDPRCELSFSIVISSDRRHIRPSLHTITNIRAIKSRKYLDAPRPPPYPLPLRSEDDITYLSPHFLPSSPTTTPRSAQSNLSQTCRHSPLPTIRDHTARYTLKYSTGWVKPCQSQSLRRCVWLL